MNKLFKCLSTAVLGIAMAVGVGVGVVSGKGVGEVKASTLDDFTEVAVDSLESGKQYLLIGNAVALPNNPILSSGKIAGVSLTNVSTTAGGYLWTFTKTGDFWLISDGTKYIYHSNGGSSGTNLAYGTSDSYPWSITSDKNGLIFASVNSGTVKTRGMLLNGTQFGGYALSNKDASGYHRIKIYKVKSSGDTLNSINLSATSKGTTALTSTNVKTDKTVQVYLTAVYQNAGAVDKTDEATWTAIDGTGSVTVSKGLITGNTAGTATVSASFGGKDAVSLTVTVNQGPKIETDPKLYTGMMVNYTKEKAITVTTNYFSGTPTIYLESSNEDVLIAEMNSEDPSKIDLMTGDVDSNTDVTLTVTAKYQSEEASHQLTVHVNVPTMDVDTESVQMKPSDLPLLITVSNVKNLENPYTLEATSSNTNAFTVETQSITQVKLIPSGEGTGTLTITAKNGDERKVSKTIPVEIKDVKQYFKLDNADDLTAGLKFVIGCSAQSKAANGIETTGTTKRISEVAATINNGVLVSDEAAVFTLGGTIGAWTISLDDNKLGTSKNGELKYGGTTTWNISFDTNGNAKIESTATSNLLIQYNSSSKWFAAYTSSQVPVQMYVDPASQKSITSITSVTADVSLTSGDEDWTIKNAVVMGRYSDSIEDENVTGKCDVFVSTPKPTITKTEKCTVTVVARSKKDAGLTKSNPNIQAQLTYVSIYNIERIYETKKAGDLLSFDGIYMGQVRDAAIVMNGEYGMSVYYGTGNVPVTFDSYTKGVTPLHIESKLEISSGLYRTNKDENVVSVLASEKRIAEIGTPSTYMITGSEDKDDAYLGSRLSNATGVIKSYSYTSGNVNMNATIEVNGTELSLFIANMFMTDDVQNKIKDSYDNKKVITIEGFTSFYNKFQIQLTGIVEKKEDYTATDFAKQIIELTDAVCDGYDGKTDNSEALKSVWLILQDTDHYLALAVEQQTILKNATADSTGDDLAKGVARYDYLVGKYNLTNFIDRDVPNVGSGLNPLISVNNIQETAWIVVIVGLVGLTAVGGYFFIRRRKENH